MKIIWTFLFFGLIKHIFAFTCSSHYHTTFSVTFIMTGTTLVWLSLKSQQTMDYLTSAKHTHTHIKSDIWPNRTANPTTTTITNITTTKLLFKPKDYKKTARNFQTRELDNKYDNILGHFSSYNHDTLLCGCIVNDRNMYL